MANLRHYRTGEVIRAATGAERMRAARAKAGHVFADGNSLIAARAGRGLIMADGIICSVDGEEGSLGVAVTEVGNRLERGRVVGCEWLVGRYVRGNRHQTLARFGDDEARARAFERKFNEGSDEHQRGGATAAEVALRALS